MEFNLRDISLRTKLIAIIIVGVLFIVLIVWLLRGLLQKGNEFAPEEQKVGETGQNIAMPVAPVPTLDEAKKNVKPVNIEEAKKQTAVSVVVRQFVERFGSFSPDSKMANFDEVKSMSTERFAAWMEGYKKTALAQFPSDVKGVTTKLIFLKNIEGDVTHQSFDVGTQRTEDTNALSRVYYQRILVKLVLEDSNWKVDSAYWQAKE